MQDSIKGGTNKHTAEDLRQMQMLPLEAKIAMTKDRIEAWLDKYDAYVSFSGGKDSTVLLNIARQVKPNIPAVFIDTGLEYPELREFVKTIPNVTWLKPEMNFRQVIKTYGYPLISKEVSQHIYTARRCPTGKIADRFEENNKHDMKYNNGFSVTRWKWLKDSDIPVSNKCCDVMKKKPLKKYEKLNKITPIVGTMACESQNRKTSWIRHGCNSFEGKRPISQPMSFWTEQDVLEYLKKYDTPYAPVYGDIVYGEDGKLHTTGCDRTGCVFCGFGCHLEKEPNRFQRLKVTHPQLWDYCMRPWNGGGLGMREVLEFIGIPID